MQLELREDIAREYASLYSEELRGLNERLAQFDQPTARFVSTPRPPPGPFLLHSLPARLPGWLAIREVVP